VRHSTPCFLFQSKKISFSSEPGERRRKSRRLDASSPTQTNKTLDEHFYSFFFLFLSPKIPFSFFFFFFGRRSSRIIVGV
jgi:hypothetical protein